MGKKRVSKIINRERGERLGYFIIKKFFNSKVITLLILETS